jgi:autotransporter translocation and assembly factor TamB
MIRFLRNIFIFLIILVAAVWILLQFETVQQKAIAKLEDTIFKATGLHVEMSRIALTLPGSVTAYDIRLRDFSDQLFVEADQADLTIDFSQILKWEPKFALNLHHAKLHFIPEHLLKGKESGSGSTSLEIRLSASELIIGPDVFSKLDLPSTVLLESLTLKNFLFLAPTSEFSGEAYAKAKVEAKPLQLQASFKRLQDQSILADFKALYNDNLPLNGKLNLSPTLQLDGTTFHIPLTNVDVLHPWIENANDYQGNIQIEGDLYGQMTAPLIDLVIQAPSLSTKDLELKHLFARIISTITKEEMGGQILLSSFINDQELSLNGDFAWPFGEMLTVHAQELHFDDLSLSDLTVKTALQSPIEHPFAIQALGTWKQTPVTVHTQGFWKHDNETWQVALHALEGEAFKFPFKLLETTTITKNSDKLTVDAFVTEVAGGKATASLTFHPQEIQGSLELQNLSLSSLPLQWEQPVKGLISLKALINGPLDAPKIQLNANAHDFLIADEAFDKLKPGSGDFSASIENNLFSGKGTLKTPDLPAMGIDLQFPLAFSLSPWEFNFDSNVPLTGNVTAEGEMAQVLQYLLKSPTSFSGNAKVALHLTGTFQQPQLNGKLDISRGAYEISEIGVLLQNLVASIDIQGPYLFIKQVTASDGKGGQLSGAGYYTIDKEQNNPFALELTLQEATLLNQDYVKIVCNGPLTFKGNSEEGTIIAQLEVSNASVNIPERSYSTINTVDVSYINIPKDTPQPQSAIAKKTSWPLALDIHLNISKSLSIKGKDLDSNWRGELAVQGTGSAPLLFGELRITDGQYLFNGNPFTINQGTITFAGDIDKKTTLYVIAGKDLDKVKIDVIAKGPVKNPEISFRSNPPMPQREILSWLLFNRGTSQITPFQGAQLSESITNLSTNQQGPDVLSKIRSTFKIDRFEIGRNANEANTGVNVEVGKYISDNILISVIKSDVNKIAIEADLTDRIKLQGQVGDDSQGKLLLKWKRDY